MKKLFTIPFALMLGFAALQGQTVILSQDFEAGSPPAGWSTTQNTPSFGWEFGSALGSSYFSVPSHTRYACSNDDAHDDNSTTANDASMDFLISPVMNLSAAGAPGIVMKCAYLQPGNWGSTGTVEVTTNGGTTWTSLVTVPTTAAWADITVNLSAYASSSSVQVGFHHNDNGNWADGMAVDDFEVRTVPALDASVIASTVPAFNAAGNVTISGTLSNEGYTTLTSCTVSYTIDGGSPVTQNFTGLNLTLGSTYNFTFTTPANVTAVGSHTLVLTSSLPNGSADANASNDAFNSTFNILSSIPVHNPILQDHTGAWCQFCPDGAVIADQVDNNYPEAIVTAVHNSDAMSIGDGDIISGQYISGYPGGLIDYYKFPNQSAVELNRGDWDAEMAARIAMVSPVSVSISDQGWNAGTREITATVSASFVGNVTADMRLNLFVVEDSVTGSGTGYNQVNYYNTVSGHPYYGAGNPIVGFIHRHVVREMAGGPWGATGDIPGSVADGSTYSHTFTYTLPAGYDENKVHLVGLVQKYNADDTQREIMNAVSVDLALTPLSTETPELGMISGVYPNPFSDLATVEFTLNASENVSIEIFDMFGKKIITLAEGFMNAGAHSARWNATDASGNAVSNGVYMVTIKGQNNSMMEKVVLSR